MPPPPEARTHWRLIALLYSAGLLAALQYAKIPHMLPGLLGQTAMNSLQQAVALSVIGAAGLLAGTFAGALAQAVGLRRTLLLGMGVGVVGALMPLASGSYALLLLARWVESVAHMAMVVAVPTLILQYCAARDRSKAMALWSCYFTVTFIAAAALAPGVLALAGWQGFAVLHALLLLAVAGALSLQLPTAIAAGSGTAQAAAPRSVRSLLQAQRRLLVSAKLRAIPATFFGYTLLFVALVSVLPGLVTATPEAASQMAVALPCASLLGTVIAMFALGRGIAGTGLVRLSGLGLVLAGAGLVFLPAAGPLSQGVVLAAFVMLGSLPAGIISTLPALFPADHPDIALVNGGLVQFGNLGNFVGSPILASLLVRFGWPSVGLYMLAGALVVMLGLLFLQRYCLAAGQAKQG